MGVALAGYPPAFQVAGEVLGLRHHLYRLSAPLAPLLGRFQGLQLEGSLCDPGGEGRKKLAASLMWWGGLLFLAEKVVASLLPLLN